LHHCIIVLLHHCIISLSSPQFTDRRSFAYRLRRHLPSFLLARRTDNLSTKVFRTAKRDIFSLRQKILGVAVFILIITVAGFIFFSGFFSVKRVSVERNSLDLPTAELEKLIGKYAFGRNLLAIEGDKLAADLKKIRPDIARVIVRRELPDTLVVEVLKYPIIAEIRVGSERILINENGYRVIGDSVEPGTLILTLGETIDLSDPKKRIAAPEQLIRLREAVDHTSALLDEKITAIRYFPIAREARLVTAKKTELWIDLTQDHRTQLDKITAASRILNLKTTNYLYLDLRIRDKIFYKKK
jgi:cell division septal protein FtsQ